MRKDEGTLLPEEDRLLRMLVVLVEDFEEKTYPIGPSNPAVALRELMREHGLKQTDMVDIFGSQGPVSQVVNGKREVSKSQAKKALRQISSAGRYFYVTNEPTTSVLQSDDRHMQLRLVKIFGLSTTSLRI